MPTISVSELELFKALGKAYTEPELSDLCFDFGLELDDVVVERKNDQDLTFYKIEIPANRYDLLCIEGLSRALLIYLGKASIPRYTLVPPQTLQSIKIEKETVGLRPYIVSAILRNITFTQESYDSFIDLQDKLHQNICRRRSLAAIGTHDLDTISGPFIYTCRKPSEIKFKPLNQDKDYTAEELMVLYSTDMHMKQYLPIIQDMPRYPVIYDKNGIVVSLPPVINGNHSKITLNTRNVFFECTATDLHKATIVMDTLVCMFGQYCEKPFIVEPVEIIDVGGKSHLYPKLKYRKQVISSEYINRIVGIHERVENIAGLLTKMCLKSSILSDSGDITSGDIEVEIPPTRHDVIHSCDIIEDVAIAYGYNNIKKTVPKTSTIAKQLPINKLSDQLALELAQAGFTEALTFSLCSRDDISEKLRMKDGLATAVHVSNPKTLEFQVTRTTLLPGILKTLHANKKMPLPMKLFEITDVVIKDESKDVSTCNKRHLCAVHYSKSPGFEIIHGLLDRIMQILEIPLGSGGYQIGSVYHPTYFPGRCAEILAFGQSIGTFGVIHPEVLENFDLNLPCAAMEINIEPFL